jgi:glutaredoxin
MNAKGLTCLVSALSLFMATASEPQSLADLAKKEKERQAKARTSGTPAKVYNDDGKSRPPEEEKATPADKAGSAGAPAGAANGASQRPAPPRSAASREGGRPDPRSFRTVSITLYVTSWCQYCRKAREYLATQPNLNVVIHDIEENKARDAERLAKSGGSKSIPVIDVEGTILTGFSASRINRAIASARNR